MGLPLAHVSEFFDAVERFREALEKTRDGNAVYVVQLEGSSFLIFDIDMGIVRTKGEQFLYEVPGAIEETRCGCGKFHYSSVYIVWLDGEISEYSPSFLVDRWEELEEKLRETAREKTRKARRAWR